MLCLCMGYVQSLCNLQINAVWLKYNGAMDITEARWEPMIQD